MDDVNEHKGLVYQESQTHIPLDDIGIHEKRAMEFIQDTLTQALTQPTKVLGVVFAIVMEEGTQLTAPNGEPSVNFIALAGNTNWQVILVQTMMMKIIETARGEGMDI